MLALEWGTGQTSHDFNRPGACSERNAIGRLQRLLEFRGLVCFIYFGKLLWLIRCVYRYAERGKLPSELAPRCMVLSFLMGLRRRHSIPAWISPGEYATIRPP